ncbi:MAG TPA: hypothetical protein VGC66_05710 [Pyrinomonadaceae bacterium]|jgi:hypothetical protein
MKNRRLNVLFIAIIALAAAPQALQDAHRLVNAAHERAENEFWSVFLSYQIPEANGAQTKGSTGLSAGTRQPETKDTCPLQRAIAQPVEVARNSRSNEAPAQLRAKREARRAGAQAVNPDAPQTVEPAPVSDEEVAAVYTVRPIVFTEEEQKVLKSAGLHARDTEKVADNASKATMASFVQENENVQIKARQLMQMDKLLQRQRTRSNRDRAESNNMPTLNPANTM